ncbi:glutamate 5-kinase [Aliiglaciecola sp. CAU 1673]|uniref:glutamate 5-kinase n=1 Tax=Aliiglaciecola sp. CAU 1673 TaxID=3032595 RepID=UPI0023DCC793|nr:glutamate 5-kinase [Aliiglaciecola sp. CAU 1673]MDF2179681.1 glutamate 5-kinase [Aliiglaciecola sp. CAU 1673]
MNEFEWRRAVIKVGSALISPDGHQCSAKYLLAIARFITESRERGKQVVIVSSGSVAAGRGSIAHNAHPSIAEKQAMAAVGQTQMMANWSRFFDFPCAQVLLTYDDFHDRSRYVNIKSTIRELLNNNILPIVNENDTVAVDVLKVGDNDNLAAYTAMVAEADTLVICSDIDGLYDADPRINADAKLIPRVDKIDGSIYALAGGPGTKVGTGGMRTKIEAADKCAESGIQTLIVNGGKGEVFDALLDGRIPGTRFSPGKSPDSAKEQWLKHTLIATGRIEVDQGARNALKQEGASLLPIGITRVAGDFLPGDAVEICHNGVPFAKGVTLYSAADLNAIKGLRSDDFENAIGYSSGEAAVHRDDLALL